MKENVELSIVIPTYNERDNIVELLDRISKVLNDKFKYEVIVVDDNSPDGTWKVVMEYSKKDNRVKVIRRINERGLSSAIMRGILESKSKIVTVMDADLQHPPEIIPTMYDVLRFKNADIVVASRYVKGGGVENWSFLRRLISRVAILVGKALEPKLRGVNDPISGFFMIRKDVIKNAKLELLGYKFLVEVLSRGRYHRVLEVPYTFKPRVRGVSKLGFKEIFKYLRLLLKLTNYRIIKFSTVGASGIFVNEGLLYLQVESGILPVYYASPLAIWASIISNFTLNEFWTFRDKQVSRSLRDILKRLIKYHGAVAIGALVNYTTLIVLITFGVYYLVANFIGILLGFITNYALSEHLVWRE